MNSVWKWGKRIISFIGLAFILLMAVFVITMKASNGEPSIFGYQLKSVLSGSMEPVFETGSIISIKLREEGASFDKGDIITFYDRDKVVVTHRITEVKKARDQLVYTTQGDSNDGADKDPVLAKQIIGEYTGFTVPYAGYALNFASSKTGSAALLFIPGAFLFLYAVVTFTQAVRSFKKEHAAPTTGE
ncbi:signal peptidase I SipW [Pontibacillus salicampi]|uniref:Signal peptidase I n=1 Tax=Pontibacillus salicampi TaxID=1449801 RepID=A0ABV6LI10_9BACI